VAVAAELARSAVRALAGSGGAPAAAGIDRAGDRRIRGQVVGGHRAISDGRTLEHFLTARYCLYTTSPDGALLRAEVHHAPWPLQRAYADIEENSIASGQGLVLDGPPSLLHFSRRLDVVVWPVGRVGAGDGLTYDGARI
jgi:uncharacterized protein YqjF (DUF2071 family)